MTYLKAKQLHEALSELSKPVVVMHKGAPIEVRCRFSGATAIKIAQMKAALLPQVVIIDEARNSVLAGYGGKVEPTNPKIEEILQELKVIAEKECEPMELGKLPRADFESGDNPVSPDTLEILLPYFE